MLEQAAGAFFGALLLACAGCSPAKHDPAARIDALMRPYTGAVPGANVLVLGIDDQAIHGRRGAVAR
jgi:hypothetical protein